MENPKNNQVAPKNANTHPQSKGIASLDQQKTSINQFLAEMGLEETQWPVEYESLKDKLIKLEKITSDNFIQTASNPHSDAQAIAKDVNFLWENEIGINPIETELFNQLSTLIPLLYNYTGTAKKKEDLSAKPLKVYFPAHQNDFQKEEYFPKSQPDSKLLKLNNHLIIKIYAQAFYFEETVFNLYKVCKPFRMLLLRNYEILERDSIMLPIREIQFRKSTTYFISNASQRYRYKVKTVKEYISQALRLFQSICYQPPNEGPYQFRVQNHILEYCETCGDPESYDQAFYFRRQFLGLETFELEDQNKKLIEQLFKNKMHHLNVKMNYNDLIRHRPDAYDWCLRGTINSLTLDFSRNYNSQALQLQLPESPMLVNSLTLKNINLTQVPLINFLLKIIVQPLKSLTLILDDPLHEEMKQQISQDNVDDIVAIFQDLERNLEIENRLKVSIKIKSSIFNYCVLDVLKKLENRDKQLIIRNDNFQAILNDVPDIKEILNQQCYQKNIKIVSSGSFIGAQKALTSYFQINTQKIKMVQLCELNYDDQLGVQDNQDEFNDQTTQSIIIHNFKPQSHSMLLAQVLKGCSNLQTLSLFCQEENDSDQSQRTFHIEPAVIKQSSVTGLKMMMDNPNITNQLIPHMLDKIKYLSVIGQKIACNFDMKFTQLEQLVIQNYSQLSYFLCNAQTLKSLTITTKLVKSQQKELGSLIFESIFSDQPVKQMGPKLLKLQYLEINVETLFQDFWNNKGPSLSLRNLYINAENPPRIKLIVEKLCKILKKGGELKLKIFDEQFDLISLMNKNVNVGCINVEIITQKGINFDLFESLIKRNRVIIGEKKQSHQGSNQKKQINKKSKYKSKLLKLLKKGRNQFKKSNIEKKLLGNQ